MTLRDQILAKPTILCLFLPVFCIVLNDTIRVDPHIHKSEPKCSRNSIFNQRVHRCLGDVVFVVCVVGPCQRVSLGFGTPSIAEAHVSARDRPVLDNANSQGLNALDLQNSMGQRYKLRPQAVWVIFATLTYPSLDLGECLFTGCVARRPARSLYEWMNRKAGDRRARLSLSLCCRQCCCSRHEEFVLFDEHLFEGSLHPINVERRMWHPPVNLRSAMFAFECRFR